MKFIKVEDIYINVDRISWIRPKGIFNCTICVDGQEITYHGTIDRLLDEIKSIQKA